MELKLTTITTTIQQILKYISNKGSQITSLYMRESQYSRYMSEFNNRS